MVNSTKVKTKIKPPATRGKGRPAVYPFSTMAVGGEFFADEASAARVRAAASMFKKARIGWLYESKKVDGGILIIRKA